MFAIDQTMSSREIAELCEKDHRNVMRDIRAMLVHLHGEGGVLKFEHSYLNTQNKPQPEFLLPKRETLILVSGYKLELRARIIDRWVELERAALAWERAMHEPVAASTSSPAPVVRAGDQPAYDPPRLMAGVAVVREARRLFGVTAARALWDQVGLPPIAADISQAIEAADPMAVPLAAWLSDKMETTISQAADGMGLADIDWATRHRIGRLLMQWGWKSRVRKVGRKTARVFHRPEASNAQAA